ncbi:class I SAM-dependent methyltransferase [Streptosporangium sp. NPDC000509]|uniref:class I SAM-dependent methyltransferase n=1 Tax=Streptosporangium sp. NPDC000509 TaxID=3366186 RepID=UPI0036862F87
MTAPAASAPNAGSYNPAATTAGGMAGELARLEAQAALSFDEELSLLRELGLTASNGPLVEVGAGSGAITRRLSQAMPDLSLVAVDIDPELLVHAEGAGAELVVADAADLPLETASAGYVLLRYVLQHLSDPAPALAEARRILRPGGRILVTEVDASCWGLADPTYPELAGIHAKMAATQQAAGGDRTIGRRLTRLLRDTGFTEVALRPFATTNDTRPTDDFAPHLGPGRLQPLLAAGVLSLREFALAADRWNRFRADPNAWVMLLGFTAAGTAPDAPADGRRPTEGIQ